LTINKHRLVYSVGIKIGDMPVTENLKKKDEAMRIMITPGDICLSEEEEEFVIDIINDTVKRMKKKR
jgi:hypothetical protein